MKPALAIIKLIIMIIVVHVIIIIIIINNIIACSVLQNTSSTLPKSPSDAVLSEMIPCGP